jgi:hypothetical protein
MKIIELPLVKMLWSIRNVALEVDPLVLTETPDPAKVNPVILEPVEALALRTIWPVMVVPLPVTVIPFVLGI